MCEHNLGVVLCIYANIADTGRQIDGLIVTDDQFCIVLLSKAGREYLLQISDCIHGCHTQKLKLAHYNGISWLAEIEIFSSALLE